MRLPRRQFLASGGGRRRARRCAARCAAAQAYPTKPVRLVVQVRGGSAPDIIARVIGEWLSERLGQPIVIDNRPGASGNIATEAVVRAPADGYTLLLAMSANAINASLYDNLRFNFIRDTAPVAMHRPDSPGHGGHPSVPAKTVPEFIAYAKANPGKINMASTGNGNAASRRRRAVQDDGRRQSGPRRLPRRAGGASPT